MVRFIIEKIDGVYLAHAMIYIPIWLDLLYNISNLCENAHAFTFQYG